MCDWNMTLIKGLIKLHALVPMRESTLPEKQHVAKPEVMKMDALDGMRLASTCKHGKVDGGDHREHKYRWGQWQTEDTRCGRQKARWERYRI